MEKNDQKPDPVITELIQIKKLLVFYLLKSGVSQKELANALGLNQSNVSRMFKKPIKSNPKVTS